MVFPKSSYSHILDFGAATALKQIAIEPATPNSIFIDGQEIKVSPQGIYEIEDVTITKIVIGTDSSEKALFTYTKK